MTFCTALSQFVNNHNKNPECQRLGQHFCNVYIKGQWSELFYCEDPARSRDMINQWLVDHQYEDQLPQPVRDPTPAIPYPTPKVDLLTDIRNMPR